MSRLPFFPSHWGHLGDTMEFAWPCPPPRTGPGSWKMCLPIPPDTGGGQELPVSVVWPAWGASTFLQMEKSLRQSHRVRRPVEGETQVGRVRHHSDCLLYPGLGLERRQGDGGPTFQGPEETQQAAWEWHNEYLTPGRGMRPHWCWPLSLFPAGAGGGGRGVALYALSL